MDAWSQPFERRIEAKAFSSSIRSLALPPLPAKDVRRELQRKGRSCSYRPPPCSSSCSCSGCLLRGMLPPPLACSKSYAMSLL
jgi:hypothetical protein